MILNPLSAENRGFRLDVLELSSVSTMWCEVVATTNKSQSKQSEAVPREGLIDEESKKDCGVDETGVAASDVSGIVGDAGCARPFYYEDDDESKSKSKSEQQDDQEGREGVAVRVGAAAGVLWERAERDAGRGVDERELVEVAVSLFVRGVRVGTVELRRAAGDERRLGAAEARVRHAPAPGHGNHLLRP